MRIFTPCQIKDIIISFFEYRFEKWKKNHIEQMENDWEHIQHILNILTEENRIDILSGKYDNRDIVTFKMSLSDGKIYNFDVSGKSISMMRVLMRNKRLTELTE